MDSRYIGPGNRVISGFKVRHIPQLIESDDDFVEADFKRVFECLAQGLSRALSPASDIQFRYCASGRRSSSGRGRVLGFVLIAADNDHQLRLLESLIVGGLPVEIDLVPVPCRSVDGLLNWISTCPKGGIVEVRRSPEDLLPLSAFSDGASEKHFVDEWSADYVDVRRVFRALAACQARTVFVIHISGVGDVRDYLEDVSSLYHEAKQYLVDEGGDSDKRLKYVMTINEYRSLVFKNGGLRVRILVQSESPVSGALLHTIGVGYTSNNSYELVRPGSAIEHLDAVRIFTELRSEEWGYSGSIMPLNSQLATARSVSQLIHIPTAPKSGLEGFQSRPISSLPRSPQPFGDSSGSIRIGISNGGARVDITTRELNQHLLVAGLPGFGKTNSIQLVLRGIWNDLSIPFLVIDPAKRDYGVFLQGMRQINGLKPRLVQLSPEFPGFNPLGVPAGCSWRSHAGRVVGAFDSALRVSESYPMGYIILSRAVFNSYDEGRKPDPTLSDLLNSINLIIETEVKDPKTKSNVKASLLGRIGFLASGPMGKVFAAKRGIDWSELLRVAVVIELKGFTGPTERSLVFGLLIAGLASFREANSTSSNSSLQHVTVLEEAHRVLSNRGGAESEGVRLLSEAIAELRGSGEGFVIVDQAPTSIDPTVRKVCGSVLVHRLIDVDERNIMGSALLLDGRQSEDLGRLEIGEGVFYGASRNSPVVVDIGRVESGLGNSKNVSIRTTLV